MLDEERLKGCRSGVARKGIVTLPCGGRVFLRLVPEPECHDLGERVVDVIKRRSKNMGLAFPNVATIKEIIFFILLRRIN